MTAPVKFAKTTRPSFASVLLRDRLFCALDRRRKSSLVWIAGPPGSGKTTLAASYVDARAGHSIWYQLDAGDGDLSTFFYYLSSVAGSTVSHRAQGRAAGRSDGPGSTTCDALPRYTGDPKVEPGQFARRYFRALYALLPASFVIVLDNYQEIPEHSAFHQLLDAALKELPTDCSIVVISRSEPPPSMARRRANREMELLGWDELRLSREESDAIVERWGAPGSDVYLEQIFEKTQGWAAGLILMLDQGSNHVEPGVMDPSAPRVVFDYLAGEIFDNFDRPTRDLLLCTAYLPEMTGAMAAQISGHPHAAETLAELHHNYHLVGRRPGPDTPIYHYHPLLVDFLIARLEAVTSREALHKLRQRCATCLEQNGALDEAIKLVIRARDWQFLARLIVAHGAELIAQGRAETLDQWLSKVPANTALDAHDIALWRAKCRALVSPREARLLFEEAFAGFAASLDTADATSQARAEQMVVCVAGVIDTVIREGDDLTLLDRWLSQAHGLVDDGEFAAGGDAEAQLAASIHMATCLRTPNRQEVEATRLRATALLDNISEPALACVARGFIGTDLASRGDLASARLYTDDAAKIANLAHTWPAIRREWLYARAAVGAHSSGLDECRAAIEDGLDEAHETGDESRDPRLEISALCAATRAGEFEMAEELGRELLAAQALIRRLDRCDLQHSLAWLAMRKGDLLEAAGYLRTGLRMAKECGSVLHEVSCRLALMSLEFGSREPVAVIAQARMLRRQLKGLGNPVLEFQGLLSQASIYFALGRARAARVALSLGLAVGRQFGLSRHGWWDDATMADLLSQALEQGIETDYARQLIRASDLAPPEHAIRSDQWAWRFQIFGLGRFQVLRDGQPLSVTARLKQKPLDLLKALVALGGSRVSEARVASFLWPRIDADSAHRSLTTTLHRLRKLLGEDQAVVLRFGRLSLNPRYCWTDVGAFERLTAAADPDHTGCHTDWHPTFSPGRYSRAGPGELPARLLDLYRGPFLIEECDDDRYLPMRQRLRNRLLRTTGELARVWSEAGQWQTCVHFIGTAIDADPVAEGLYRWLMLCYRDAGMVPEAMDVYEQCRQMCAVDQREEPSPETAAVFKLVLQTL